VYPKMLWVVDLTLNVDVFINGVFEKPL